jgi:hypothetical protein
MDTRIRLILVNPQSSSPRPSRRSRGSQTSRSRLLHSSRRRQQHGPDLDRHIATADDAVRPSRPDSLSQPASGNLPVDQGPGAVGIYVIPLYIRKFIRQRYCALELGFLQRASCDAELFFPCLRTPFSLTF